jgi:hypothetical protein
VELLAYIDPGAGSLFIQAVPFFLRTQIRRGIDRLRGRPSGVAGSANAAGPSDDVVPPTQP